jgi:hypothetical protein
VFCSRCGTQINDDGRFCPSCGAPQRLQTSPQQSQPAIGLGTFVVLVLIVLLVIGQCSRESQPQTNDVQPSAASEPQQPEQPSPDRAGEGGEPVPVLSDPRARYWLLDWSRMSNGNLEALTRRSGPSGVRYARREIDCGTMTFRYLGEGDSVAEARQDSPNPGGMGDLVAGSISTEVSQFVCRKARK